MSLKHPCTPTVLVHPRTFIRWYFFLLPGIIHLSVRDTWEVVRQMAGLVCSPRPQSSSTLSLESKAACKKARDIWKTKPTFTQYGAIRAGYNLISGKLLCYGYWERSSLASVTQRPQGTGGVIQPGPETGGWYSPPPTPTPPVPMNQELWDVDDRMVTGDGFLAWELTKSTLPHPIVRPAVTGECWSTEVSRSFISPVQMLISPGNALTDTTKNNVLLAIWTSLSFWTHKINHPYSLHTPHLPCRIVVTILGCI